MTGRENRRLESRRLQMVERETLEMPGKASAAALPFLLARRQRNAGSSKWTNS